ncbi:TetR/AcrR family transcriptional regulator [Kineosporia succinea]|uniref:AcrR family transcriptional regulator n=1 Tax=Kineosporia succinea TaxID=84632 RepID=A0ABT9PA82_9ACTN|nr:TetR/AcrR family transcriptional regulator [Kineosporia succinea]MDP9829095.1 AcrR family transcriptional regulator [Kineosporia succinea]
MTRQELREDARRNREALVAVAREVFQEQGTEASLRDVARRAGVGIGTLYRHFPHRTALLEAVLAAGIDGLRDHADELMTNDDPGEALNLWMTRLATRSAAYRGLPGEVLAAMKDESSDLHRSCTQMQAAAGRLLARAQSVGAVRAGLTGGDVVTMCAAAGWVQQFGGEESSERMLAVLANGLAP